MTGYVYAIAAGGAVKIGWSADPLKRLSKIQSDNNAQCELVGCVEATIEQEQELHSLLASWRVQGEWFATGNPAVDGFVALVRGRSLGKKPKKFASHGLGKWLHQSGMTDAEFAALICANQSTINRIKRGVAMPSLRLVTAINAATNGAVTANDFLFQPDHTTREASQ